MLESVWCVRSMDEWHAYRINRKPGQGTLVTRCQRILKSTGGCAKRLPTCEECLRLLEKKSG